MAYILSYNAALTLLTERLSRPQPLELRAKLTLLSPYKKPKNDGFRICCSEIQEHSSHAESSAIKLSN